MTNSERIADNLRMWQVMRLVVAEWTTDPRSVECFDLRIVEEAVSLVERHQYPQERT
jgi:hypothetical protein